MSAAAIIKPFLLEANQRKPHLARANTHASCFELLELTLALAGPDWKFIGKSSRMDGAAVRPHWFSPMVVPCRRPDGQLQDVLIDGLGMDAAWHMPTMTQVKVIVFSGANEHDSGTSGPAQLTPYDIARIKDGQVQYRWHNPPMPQTGEPVVPMPTTPGAPVSGTLPERQEMMEAGLLLDAFYRAPEGLQRPNGMSIGGRPDWEGVGAWLFDVYLKQRLAGKNATEALEEVFSQIRKAGGPTGEWQSKHPGQTP